MKSKIKLVTALVFVALFSLVLSAKATMPKPPSYIFFPSAWQFKRTLTVPTNADFVKIILPNGISVSNRNFEDLRIIDTNGNDAPYLISRNIKEEGGAVKASILNKVNKNGNTEFIADTGVSGVVHAGISIDINNANFKRQVSIYSSNTPLPLESGNWALVTKNGYIFKFTDTVTGFTSGKNDITFSPNTARYFKVVIASGEGEWLDVFSAIVYGDISISRPTYEKKVSVEIFNNGEKKTSELVADLGKEGFLTHAITLKTVEQNFNRRVIIESSNDKSTWRVVGQGYISSIKTPLFEGSSTRLSFSEQSSRYIKASVVNDDNKPLAFGSEVTFEGPVISAIFKTEPGADYILYYGNPNATRPEYDISRISSYIEENKIPIVQVGEEVLNPEYVPPKGPVVPFTEKYKFLLNLFLVIVVLGIGTVVALYLKNFTKHKDINEETPGFTKE